MKLNYQTREGKLYSSTGEAVLPDEKGIVTVMIEGSVRRFVLDKFIENLEAGKEIKLRNAAGKRQGNSTPRVKVDRPAKTPTKPSTCQKKGYSKHSSVPCKAMDKEGNVFHFDSGADAAKHTGVSKSSVNKIVAGEFIETKGWRFARPEADFPEYKCRLKTNEHRTKPVLVTTPTGEVKEFKSIVEAHKKLSIARARISHSLNVNHKPIKGYQFKFKTA